MISVVLILVLLVTVKSAFQYPSYANANHHVKLDTILETMDKKKELPSNSVLPCAVEDIMDNVGFDEIEQLVDALAHRKGISSLTVLRKLIRILMSKDLDEQNSVDGAIRSDFFNQPLRDLPPRIEFPLETSRVPYYLPPDSEMDEKEDDPNLVIIPVASRPELKPKNEDLLSKKINNMISDYFAPMKNQLIPPLGAIVRVDFGNLLSPLSRDISITISPLMSVIEALRQAENKYRSIFGLTHDTDVITFHNSPSKHCFVVKSIDDVFETVDNVWKLRISDCNEKTLYESFCLPTGKENFVKPGWMISVMYVRL